MDSIRFDTGARRIGAASNRRAVVYLFVGLATSGLVLLDANDAEARRGCNPRCGACEHCQKGACRNTQSGGKRCKTGKCRPKPAGNTCGSGGQRCLGGVCVCPDGTTLLHGACATTTCVSPSPPGNCSGASCKGITCPNQLSCGHCDLTTDGEVVCVNLGPPCADLSGCQQTGDCPLGQVCVTNGCCAFQGKPNVCADLV